MRRPIVSKSERSGTGVDMANLSKAVCHGESDKCRFRNTPQESNFQRLGITGKQARLSREYIDLAREEFISTHRPRLIVREVYYPVLYPKPGEPFDIVYTIANIGDTRQNH